MGLYLERMTPSFFSFGRKRRDAALREDERKSAEASAGAEQAASRRRFAADLGALASEPAKPEPVPEPRVTPVPPRPVPAPPLSEADAERRERIDPSARHTTIPSETIRPVESLSTGATRAERSA